MKVGTFIPLIFDPGSAARWWANVPAAARDADEFGYDYVACDESLHDSTLTMTLAAASSERVELETSVTLAFPRSPFVLAMQAWDLQMLSKGRFILGLGCSIPSHNERRLSVPSAPGARRMKEYIQCLHAIWDTFQNNTKPDFVGQYYRFQLMPANYNPGPIQFPRPKVFLGAISNAMARVAGEVADGALPGGFTTEKYMREVYLPMIKVGLDRAGRTWNDIEIHGGPVSVFDESESEIDARLAHPFGEKFGTAQERAARLIVYAFSGNPYFIRVRTRLFELHGWHDLAERLHALAREGKSQEEMLRILPEEVLQAFVPPSSTLDGLPETLRTHFEYARRIEFNMLAHTPAERDRLQHILKQVQATETPGIPVGLG